MNSLSIGAGPEQLHAIRTAKRMGLKVVAVDRDASAPGMAEADEAHVLSTDRAPEIVELARQSDIKLILPAPIGRFLTTVGYVNDQLGLKGVGEAAALNCVDKRKAHLCLRAADVPVADQVLVSNEVPALPFALPVIIKPRFGAGSRGVQVCRTAHALKLARQAIDGDALIETLIEGTEYGVDGAVFDGRAEVWLIRRKRVTAGDYRADMAYVTASDTGEGAIADSVGKAVRAVGIGDCLFHADVIVDANGVAHIIELSGRPSGMNISAKLLPLATGVDVVAAAVAHLSGAEAFPVAPQSFRPSALVYFPFDAGRVVSLGHFETAAQWAGVVELNCPLKVGDELQTPSGCADFLKRGYALMTADTESGLMALADRVCAHVAKEVRIDR
ncbi:MAG: ATP-grasp domain-containing protein [Asticcacaulis sp.]